MKPSISTCITISLIYLPNAGGIYHEKLDAALLPDFKTWTAPPLPSEIPHGDMPGDKVHIGDDHIAKANRVFLHCLKKPKPCCSKILSGAVL